MQSLKELKSHFQANNYEYVDKLFKEMNSEFQKADKRIIGDSIETEELYQSLTEDDYHHEMIAKEHTFNSSSVQKQLFEKDLAIKRLENQLNRAISPNRGLTKKKSLESVGSSGKLKR